MNKTNGSYYRSTQLKDIVDLQRVARGIDMAIAQLDPGPFDSEIAQLKVCDVLASRICPNRRLRVQGQVQHMTASIVLAPSGRLNWFGKAVGQSDLLVANVDEHFDLVLPAGSQFYCITAIGKAEMTLRNLGGPVLARKFTRTDSPVPCDPDCMEELRTSLTGKFENMQIDENISRVPARELEQWLLRQLAMVVRVGETPTNKKGNSARLEVVQRVERHILEDLTLPRSVDELCSIAGTSRRTLEYAFKGYFGTSPKKFIKALRLNAARNDLLMSDYVRGRVIETASGWGFTHMGQFSSDYRHLFGELPSETLKKMPLVKGAGRKN